MSAALPEPLLSMRNVSKAFGRFQALSNVSLEVCAGEVHALIGENGAGKSTLMKVLSGAHLPDSGTMSLDGMPYAPRGPREGRECGVSMIYQELTIAPHLTVEANVMLGREHTRAGWVRRAAQRRLVARTLEQLGHGEISPDARTGSLGLAARQIVEIARALVSEARVIVFDEPTSVLGGHDIRRLFDVIDKLRARGLAIVYISHFLEEVQRVADRFTVLRDGQAVATGRMAQASLHEIITAMVGRELEALYPQHDRQCGGSCVSIENLRGERVPRAVDLDLRQGEVLGIAGLVGAGRTETLRVLLGLDRLEAGRVVVWGRESSRSTPHARIRQGFGMLSEDRKGEGLAVRLSVEDNIALSCLNQFSRAGWLGLRRRRSAALDQIRRLKIRARHPGQRVETLSGGNQQKVALARLLQQDARIFLLDEPTRGIDVGSKAEIYRLICELAARGKSVVFVSSYLPELLGTCDRIAVMSRGRVSEIRPASAWTEHAIMTAATSS